MDLSAASLEMPRKATEEQPVSKTQSEPLLLERGAK
jgi:hypothetical protein